MNTPEQLRRSKGFFDSYAVAMSAIVAPNEFVLLDESRTPSERLALIKTIAIASLHEVVLLSRGDSSSNPKKPSVGFCLDVVDQYYESDRADRLAEPVKLFQPNPFLTSSFFNKIVKSRISRISIPDLLAGLPVNSLYDEAVELDVETVFEYCRVNR